MISHWPFLYRIVESTFVESVNLKKQFQLINNPHPNPTAPFVICFPLVRQRDLSWAIRAFIRSHVHQRIREAREIVTEFHAKYRHHRTDSR